MFGGGTTAFGQTSAFGAPQQQQQLQPVSFGGTNTTATPQTGPRDFEVNSPPDDSISCMQFSPATVPQIFLIAGSWDNQVMYSTTQEMDSIF
jgi:hypothetical protein